MQLSDRFSVPFINSTFGASTRRIVRLLLTYNSPRSSVNSQAHKETLSMNHRVKFDSKQRVEEDEAHANLFLRRLSFLFAYTKLSRSFVRF